MKNLIKITTNNKGEQGVSARDLHSFLGSKQDFSNWIQHRIKTYKLIEGIDYIVFNDFIVNPTGGRPSVEYSLSMDTAKQLSMVERNEKGRQARMYFIECERVVKNSLIDLNDPKKLQLLLLENVNKVIKLEDTVKDQAPKVNGFDKISNADGSLTISASAKHLQINPLKKLRIWLQKNRWVFRRTGQTAWYAYQKRTQQGYMVHKVTTIDQGDGEARVFE